MPCSRTQHSDAGHAQNQAFLPGGGGGGGGGGVLAQLPENSFFFFSPQLILQFYNGLFQIKL